MLHVWIGFLKLGPDEVPQPAQQLATEFLNQPLIKICSAGPLRNASGSRGARGWTVMRRCPPGADWLFGAGAARALALA
jgi:hypothetical protein